MLTFVLSDGYEVPWHVGEPKPEIWQHHDNKTPPFKFPNLRRYVTDVIADFDELAHIRRKFVHLPDVQDDKVMHWSGDLAQFIYHNL